MKSILKVYKTYTDAIHGYQKMVKKYPDAEQDILNLTVTFGCVRSVRFNFIGNLEGFKEHGYDEVRYDPSIKDEVDIEFGVIHG
jgi:hypothetical protein